MCCEEIGKDCRGDEGADRGAPEIWNAFYLIIGAGAGLFSTGRGLDIMFILLVIALLPWRWRELSQPCKRMLAVIVHAMERAVMRYENTSASTAMIKINPDLEFYIFATIFCRTIVTFCCAVAVSCEVYGLQP